MRTRLIATPLLTLAALCAANASAQAPTIKPGLWQLDVATPGKTNGNAMAGYLERMKEQMASMPPEQRKQIEKQLADLEARGTEFTGNGLRTKQCITSDNIAKFDPLGQKNLDSCTRTSSPTAGGVKVSMTCTRPQIKIDADVKFQGEKAYTFESLATVQSPDGKERTQKSSGTGTWLGSDCGKIKPAAG